MSKAKNNGIKINVLSEYIPERSNPLKKRYFFAYHITIQNTSNSPAKLISRYWHITDAEGNIEEIRGPGVVGYQPRLTQDESFEYTSGTIINTPVGTMYGTYQMVADNGYEFDAEIPMFSLNIPKVLN